MEPDESDGGFRTRGLKAVKEGLAFDNDGKWEQALHKYTQACELFLTSAKYEKNERSKEMTRAKTKEYLARCETLKQWIAEGRTPPPKAAPAPASGTAQAKKPDGKKGGSATSSEADKMKEALSEAIQMETPDVRHVDEHRELPLRARQRRFFHSDMALPVCRRRYLGMQLLGWS